MFQQVSSHSFCLSTIRELKLKYSHCNLGLGESMYFTPTCVVLPKTPPPPSCLCLESLLLLSSCWQIPVIFLHQNKLPR